MIVVQCLSKWRPVLLSDDKRLLGCLMFWLERRGIGDSKRSWSFQSRWTSEDYLSVGRACWSELFLQLLLKLLDSLFGSLFLPTKNGNPCSEKLFSLLQLGQEGLSI